MPEFIPGLELSRRFFVEAVKPAVAAAFPKLRYSAALLGSGSEILGFDTEMSTDHDWGPRVDLFLDPGESEGTRSALGAILRETLPSSFGGYATSFTIPVSFFQSYLGFDPANEIEPADWLTFPEQKLRTIACGPIFHDDLGLDDLRRRFAYYPRDIWLYLLAAGWTRIGEEEHLMGRAGSAGDEIGSAVIGARLVRDLMRLAFLMERTYAPYAKWLGTAFKQLACAETLSRHLSEALSARTWGDRETHLVRAYENLAAMHNRLAITPALSTTARDFFNDASRAETRIHTHTIE